MENKTFKVIVSAESEDQLPSSAGTFQDFLNDISVDGETYTVKDYKEEASD